MEKQRRNKKDLDLDRSHEVCSIMSGYKNYVVLYIIIDIHGNILGDVYDMTSSLQCLDLSIIKP